MMWRWILLGVMYVGIAACSPKNNPAWGKTATSGGALQLETETVDAFLARFNDWFRKANQLIMEGYEKASAAVELEEGGEWGCDWEMDYQTINAATRVAIQGTDVLHSDLVKTWLKVLDAADAQGVVYSVGRLMFMDGFEVNAFGEKIAEFYAVADVGKNDGEQWTTEWEPASLCAGMAVTGHVHVILTKKAEKFVLVGAKYVE
jgi:hypothetical protein